MRGFSAVKVALLGGALCMMLSAGSVQAVALVNGNWEDPVNLLDGTSTVATGWTMSDAIGATFTNPGQREAFGANGNNTPGGRWGFWLQGFTLSGDARQTVGGIVPGDNYTFGTDIFFEANYATIPNIVTSLSIQYLNAISVPIGAPSVTNITPAESVTGSFLHFSVSGVAPAGAAQATVKIAWAGDGASGGGLSAFADSATLVPEPASLGFLSFGALSLLAKRRHVKAA